MGKSTVYFTDFRCPVGTSQLDKLKKLCIAAGIKDIDMDGKFVAIKMHFGELGNMAFLRPNYAKVIADLCKEQGGMPFLTDCNTLYPGSRKNALEHLDCANLNGFNTTTTGCQIIIGDGLRGTDEVEVPVVNGEYCKTALIGHAIMEADIFISLSHFKGHEATGFGGAIKNIGMGCGSRAGKMQQHASGKPAINTEVCRGCRRCAKECGSDAITYVNKKAVIDYDKCKGCGRCIGACSFDAVYNPNDSANELLDRKMAEYAQAVCHDRPHFHIALVQDISPNCDCHGENDAPILPDIGMFASFDPVALDQACADACLNATPIANSQLGEHLAEPGWHCHHDHFKDSNPNIEWKATLDQAEKIGLGTREYELKRIKSDMYFEYGEKELIYLKQKDKRLAEVINQVGMIERTVDDDLFSSVVHHIVGQQISTKAQATIWQRMKDYLGTVDADTILNAGVEHLQPLGISFRKAEYITDFAEKVKDGSFDIEGIWKKSDEEAIEELSSLKGIGVWTAEMILLFCMQRPNVLSFGDLAIQRGMRMIYHHRKIDRKLFEKYRRRLSPYCSVASLYFWAAAGGAVPGLKDHAPKSGADCKKKAGIR